MIKGKENIICSPEQMAVELYAPFYLLLSISDATPQKKEREKIKDRYEKYIDDFFRKYSLLSD